MVRNIEYKFDSYKESQGRNAGSNPVPTTYYKNVMTNGKRMGFLFMPKNIELIVEDSLTSMNLYSG